MIDEKQLIKLRYFLECYFNVSADYSELDAIINEYKKTENEEYIEDLKEEVKLLLSVGNIDFIRNFIKKYGMRTIKDDNKVMWLMEQIIYNKQ